MQKRVDALNEWVDLKIIVSELWCDQTEKEPEKDTLVKQKVLNTSKKYGINLIEHTQTTDLQKNELDEIIHRDD